MGRCGYEMMIECEVNSGQAVESIEKTRRDEEQFVYAHRSKQQQYDYG